MWMISIGCLPRRRAPVGVTTTESAQVQPSKPGRAALGFTWLATVPPTAGLIGKLFGVRYLATLFGLAVFTHQIGGFFGAWLGGIALVRFGDYGWMWYADMLLALAAAFINLPIRELLITPTLSGPAGVR